MEEFLSLNEDYIKLKKDVDKKDARGTVFAILFIFASIIATAVLGVFIGIIPSVLFLAIALITAVCLGVSKENKEKQKLADYGAQLYKEYLKENNFI